MTILKRQVQNPECALIRADHSHALSSSRRSLQSCFSYQHWDNNLKRIRMVTERRIKMSHIVTVHLPVFPSAPSLDFLPTPLQMPVVGPEHKTKHTPIQENQWGKQKKNSSAHSLPLNCCVWHTGYRGWTPVFRRGAAAAWWTNEVRLQDKATIVRQGAATLLLSDRVPPTSHHVANRIRRTHMREQHTLSTGQAAFSLLVGLVPKWITVYSKAKLKHIPQQPTQRPIARKTEGLFAICVTNQWWV